MQPMLYIIKINNFECLGEVTKRLSEDEKESKVSFEIIQKMKMKFQFLAELLETSGLFKWKNFLMKCHIFSQDLGI